MEYVAAAEDQAKFRQHLSRGLGDLRPDAAIGKPAPGLSIQKNGADVEAGRPPAPKPTQAKIDRLIAEYRSRKAAKQR